MNDDGRQKREERRRAKRAGNRRVRRDLKRQLERAPDEAPFARVDYGRDRAADLDPPKPDPKRRRRGPRDGVESEKALTDEEE